MAGGSCIIPIESSGTVACRASNGVDMQPDQVGVELFADADEGLHERCADLTAKQPADLQQASDGQRVRHVDRSCAGEPALKAQEQQRGREGAEEPNVRKGAEYPRSDRQKRPRLTVIGWTPGGCLRDAER